MAERTRAFDWASTPAGPVDQWPDLLLNTVNTLLASRHPMFLWWGSDLVQFYNDAYRPSIDPGKHPRALGQNGRDCWPEIWHIIGSQIDSVMTTGAATWNEDQLVPILRNGALEDVYWTYSYSPVRNAIGDICGTLVVCTETTGRVIADRRLQQMVEAATDGVMVIGSDWTITYVNDNARQFLSFMGDLVGVNFWERFPDTATPGSIFESTYRATMEHGTPGDFEAFYPEPLNAWYRVNSRPLDGGIILFFSDITTRKTAEETVVSERTRLFDALQQAPAFFTLLEGPNHVFKITNPPYEELIGRHNILGKSVCEVVPEAESQGFINILDRVYQTGEPFIGNNIPIELARDAGEPLETRYLDFTYQPRRDPDGSISGIIVLGIDVTDRKKSEEVLIQTEKLAAVGRLASSIAHEINNPLEAVTNLLYLAQHHIENPDARHYINMAEVELRRVSVIANQTLRFYRQTTNPRPIHPADLVNGTLPLYQGKLANSNVKVELRDRTLQPLVCFDGEIRQVLSNLVGNAIDAMSPKGGRLLIRSREATHQPTGRHGVLFTVADTGCGMSPHTLARIFKPFFTTKGISGTGLGLWISHEIVERHQGILRARSSQSAHHGTVFTIFLPCEAATTA